MSREPVYRSTGRSQTLAGLPSPTAAHEPRAAFRPSERPGRRAAAAGLDKQDLADSQEQGRKRDPRRRERVPVDRGDE